MMFRQRPDGSGYIEIATDTVVIEKIYGPACFAQIRVRAVMTDDFDGYIVERAVLGGILVDPVRLDDAVDLIGEADFFRDAHKRIWAAMRQIATAGGAIDLVTVRAALGAHLEDAGGSVYLAGLVDGVSRSSNVAHYRSWHNLDER